MHNQMTYIHHYNSNTSINPLNSSKLTSPTHLKTFDKTLSSPNIKHYASNPNLSLEVNAIKTSGMMAESHTYSPTLNKINN
jgi:hypothetical protein